MAAPNFVGHQMVSAGGTGTGLVDSTQRMPLLTRVEDDKGNEYIYLSGVASTAAGDWVRYYGDGTTTRLAGTPETGFIAVALGNCVAGQFGFYQIVGVTPATTNILTDASGDKKPLYQTATAGRASTTAVATKAIFGAFCFGNPASNVGPAQIDHPFTVGNATI